ncbi:MAG: PilT/PilU family type 4a pilus ATPase [Verrucomicrobia bacterium]|nr:PilT/PilU family type 4a pilus ATPase [Verrucomicrobiota bacterium]
MDLRDLLQQVVQYNASDLHLTEGMPPIFRIDGELRPAQMEALTREDTRRLIYGVLNDAQKVKFEETHELDLSLYIPGISRFRVNVHQQRGSVEAAFRVVMLQIRTIGELGLPPVVGYLAERPNGLVICTGPTGTGKTTTLAAMVEHINQRRRCMIITVEDPIEYLFKNQNAVIKQREVGADTPSFASALKYVLRQDPDVILVGEMRDLETIATAVTAAETGHLVMSTLHTPDAAQTIDRIIDVFPPHQQQQIQIQLAGCLQGIIAQQLIPRADGQGRIVSVEVLVATEAIRSCVRDHRTAQIPTMLQTGSQYGMMTMDRSLKNLYMRGLITYEEAMLRARHPQDFANL